MAHKVRSQDKAPSVARRVRLTDTRVDGLKPAAKEFTVWDTEPRRFGVRVLTSGAKVFVLRLRYEGTQAWITIGRYGDGWRTVSARTRAEELIGLAAKGVDLRVLRARTRKIPSVARLAVVYLHEYGDVYLKPGSRDRLRTSLVHVVRRLRKVRVDRVTNEDAQAFHASMKATPIAANRALVALHGLMKFAIRKGYRTDNPAKGIRYYPEKQRERYLTPEETARLARTLAEAEEAGKESPFVLAAFKLILLTGCRQGEIFKLKWSEVRPDRGVLELEDSKTGSRTVYVNEAAQDVLAALPRVEGNPYVIVGWKKGDHYKGEAKAWQRIREAAGLPTLRLHDLRHNYASVLASGGASLVMIGKLLGHRRVATTQRYAHLTDGALRELTEKASAALDVVTSPPPGGKILPHRRVKG